MKATGTKKALSLILLCLVTGCTPSVRAEREAGNSAEERRSVAGDNLNMPGNPSPSVNQNKAEAAAAVMMLALLVHSHSASVSRPDSP